MVRRRFHLWFATLSEAAERSKNALSQSSSSQQEFDRYIYQFIYKSKKQSRTIIQRLPAHVATATSTRLGAIANRTTTTHAKSDKRLDRECETTFIVEGAQHPDISLSFGFEA